MVWEFRALGLSKFFDGADLAEKSLVERLVEGTLNCVVGEVRPVSLILFLDRRKDRLVDGWVTSIIINDIIVDDLDATAL